MHESWDTVLIRHLRESVDVEVIAMAWAEKLIGQGASRSELLYQAFEYAYAQHHGQFRAKTKAVYSPEYIWHPVGVAYILRFVTDDEEMLAAALLHDVVEDTDATLVDIEERFGSVVASYVDDLTDISKPEDGDRATRKAIDREHSAQAQPRSQTIKLADLIHNTVCITQYDPGFAVTYLEEKRRLLDVMTDGDPDLYRIAKKLASPVDNEDELG